MNEQYAEQGYLHVRRLFDAREVEEMREALDRILADVEGTAHDRNHRWGAVAQEAVLKGFHDVQYHAAAFTRAAAHPRMVEVPLEERTPLPATAGDVVFFNYLTIHGSGVNGSDRPRRNVLFQYRDREDPPLLRKGARRTWTGGRG